MSSQITISTLESQHVATELFKQGRLEDASRLLSETISQKESGDLWNDWAVVQLGLAERALRRALQLGPARPEIAANLGVLLFSTGKRDEAVPLLQQALASASGPPRVQIETLLAISSANENEDSANPLGCCAGKIPLVQRGQKMGRPRGSQFHQAWRCRGCGYMFFDTPPLESLAAYYQDEYPKSATSWYNADNDYEESHCGSRAQDVLQFVKKYSDTTTPLLHECGCSFGGTVAKLRSLGYEATGTELNSSAVRDGTSKGNRWIFAESEADFFRHNLADYDAVYLYHALEHMPSAAGFLTDIRSAVQKQGIVFIAVPNSFNYFSLSKSFTDNSWFAFPDHLHYFSSGSLPCLARAAGYEILEADTRMLASSDADAAALMGIHPDSYEWQLRERVIQRALMGHELRFVLTPVGSSIAGRFAEQIRDTYATCMRAREQEVRLLEFCAR